MRKRWAWTGWALQALVHARMALLLSWHAPISHPKPRVQTLRKPIDHEDFRCPSGAYLEHLGLPDKTPKLQRHVKKALGHSLLPSQLDAPPISRPRGPQHNATLFYTHESAAWPKPARCQARRQHVCRFNPHFCLLLPQGNSPRTSLVSERHGIEFRQVWKVASSSLASFFYCNMWGDLRSEKLLPTQPPTPRKAGKGGGGASSNSRVVFPAREPTSRFIAASIEVLERLLNHVSPGGQRMPDEMYQEPSGPFAPTTLKHTTSWYGPLQKLLNVTDPAEKKRGVYALVNGFVEDIECGIVYSAAEHLATQLSFLTSGYAERASLDFQIRLSNVTTDLEALGKTIHYTTSHKKNHNTTSVWKCPLGRENDAAGKNKMVVGKEDFQRVLKEYPSLMQRVCTVYIQDYLCLGFPLPAECEGGRELEWLKSGGSAGGGTAAAAAGGADGLGEDAAVSLHAPAKGGGKHGGDGGGGKRQGKKEGKQGGGRAGTAAD